MSGEVLTEAKILARTKLSALSEVRNLNLWGNDYSDIRVLRQLPNVEVLSLSVNQISSLADLAACTNLRELYLRKNKIAELSEILYLVGLPHLRILWLSENPCCTAPNYREYILQKLPLLQKLDNSDITNEEREMAKRSADPRQRTGSIGESEFLSPKSAARIAGNSFGSPRRNQAGQRSAFNFSSSVGNISSPAPSPKRSEYRRDEGAAFIRSPPPQQRAYANDDAVLQLASPRRYTVASPHGSVYSPNNRAPRIPQLTFPTSPRSVVPRSARASPTPVSRVLVHEIAAEGETAAEAAARKRTDALEEEIRQLRLAEDAERQRESARNRVASPRREQPRTLRSPPTSPRRDAYASPPRSSRSDAAPLSPSSAASAAAYTGAGALSARQFTTNQTYGSPSARPASARPAGERPNHVPVFARASLENGAASERSRQSARPSTAAPAPASPRGQSAASSHQTPLSPRSVAVRSAPAGSAPAMTPRSNYGKHAPPLTQHNLMCAALAMLEEFDLVHLQWLQKATQLKINSQTR